MATIPRSLHLLFPSLHPTPKCHQTHKPFLPIKPPTLSLTLSSQKQSRLFLTRAAENGAQTEKEPETEPPINQESTEEASDLGAEIKKAMMEREKGGEEAGGFLSGVAEEIGKIEWPDFGKVLGTTGVVLGVIAGSSVVLLTVNAVLAELSDKVFVGKGVQDFFGG